MSFVPVLLEWYQLNARELPWRSCHTAYCIWVSEVMLQQTQVDTVIPYFNRWMSVFPNIQTLSEADEQSVLSLWEGLGYYSRGRNLLKAAKIITDDLDGQLPQTLKDLQKLPGIGRYTAAAIASIAFNLDIAAVDGNIRRVISRLFDVTEPARSTQGERKILSLAQANLPSGQASDYNQAMMDLGATICLSSKPKCDECPVKEYCVGFQRGVQEERPVKKPRKAIPHLTVTAGVIRQDGRVLLAKRPSGGLLGGLWEFPGGTVEEFDENLEACLEREIFEELGIHIHVGAAFGKFKHAYTHFKITLHAFLCTPALGEEPKPLESDGLAWVTLPALEDYPMGKVDRLIARKLLGEGLDESLSS